MTFFPQLHFYQTRTLFISGVVILALAGAQPFLWRFVASSAKTYHDKRTEQQQLINLQARLDDISQRREQQRGLLEQLSAVYPPESSEPQIVEHLEQLADRAGVSISIEHIGESEPVGNRAAKHLVPLVITATVTGAPQELLQYMEVLEHMPEVAHITSWTLNISSREGMSTAQQGNARLMIVITFFLQAG